MATSTGEVRRVPDLPTALARMLARSERAELRNLSAVLLAQHAAPAAVATRIAIPGRIAA